MSAILPVAEPTPRLKSLLDLPNELLSHLIAFLELPTILTLSQISPRFTTLITDKIWRDIDLRAHPGECESCGEGPHVDISVEGAIRLADKHKAEVQRAVRDVLLEGTRERWGIVESLKIAPRPGAIHGLIQILDLASPALRELVIQSGAFQLDADAWVPSDHATLDVAMLDCELSFPHLTHVTIWYQSCQFAEFIPLLCNAAPALIHLDVDLEQSVAPSWMDSSISRFPDFVRDTEIRHLRVLYGHNDDDSEDTLSSRPVSPVVISLLKRIPRIQQLIIRYDPLTDTENDDDELVTVSDIIEAYEDLRDLYWHHPIFYLLDRHRFEQVFPSLRRMSNPILYTCDLLSDMPTAPLLSIIQYDRSCTYLPPSPKDRTHLPPECLAKLSQAQMITPRLAWRIRKNKHLRVLSILDEYVHVHGEGMDVFVKLDEVAASGKATGYVSSFSHGEEDLLHVRLFLDVIEISDDPPADAPDSSAETRSKFEYEAAIDTERVKTFDMLPEPVWQYFTWWNQLCVPLGVIERMREVEGMGEEEWYRRGVKVGEAAWAVLAEWEESCD